MYQLSPMTSISESPLPLGIPTTNITESQSFPALCNDPTYHLNVYTEMTLNYIELQRQNLGLKADNKQLLRIITNLKNQIKEWMDKYQGLETKYKEQENTKSDLRNQINDKNNEMKQLQFTIKRMTADQQTSCKKSKRSSHHRRSNTHHSLLSSDIKTKIRHFENAAARNKAFASDELKTKKRKDSNASIQSMESTDSHCASVMSEYSGASTVSVLSLMGYHSVRSPSVPFSPNSPNYNPLPNYIGMHRLHDSSDRGSETESLSSTSGHIKTWHADGRKKRKCKGGKSHRTDFTINRDQSIENMRRQQPQTMDNKYWNENHSVSVKQIKKVFTSNGGGNKRKQQKKKKKKKRRSFYTKKNENETSNYI